MKRFTLAALAGAILLSGCATGNPDGTYTKSEETYVPLGTLIARKAPSRADNTTIVDKQSLENDRIMGGAERDGRR